MWVDFFNRGSVIMDYRLFFDNIDFFFYKRAATQDNWWTGVVWITKFKFLDLNLKKIILHK